MSREIHYNREARKKLMQGADKLADAVKVTLGAKGRNVILQQEYANPHVTKDGVTVAENIALSDPIENMGAEMVRSSATKARDAAGDGCQPYHSKVLTPNGWTTMGEVNKGDIISGTNMSSQEVLEVYEKGERDIYKLTLSDGRSVLSCGYHVWTVTTVGGKTLNMTTQELLDSGKISKENKRGHKRYNFFLPKNTVEFKPKNNLVDPYLIGVLIGDGSFRESGSIELSLGYPKRHILDKLVYPEDTTLNSKEVEDKNYIRHKIKSTSLKDELKDMGLYNKKSVDKFIPDSYLYSSFSDRKKLLYGLLDTDGYINNKGLFEFSTVSSRLAENFQELCWSLGYSINLSINSKREGGYSSNPIYRITQLKGYKYGHKIISVEKTGKKEPVKCLRVSNQDSLYITDNYIVTHNTTTTVIIAQALIKESLKILDTPTIAKRFLGKDYVNPMDLKRGIDKGVEAMVDRLSELAEKVSHDHNRIEQIATISANGDTEIGGLIADAMKQVGSDGIISLQESKGTNTFVDVVDGLRFVNGLLHPAFVTNSQKVVGEYEDVNIVFINSKVNTTAEILPIIELGLSKRKPLIIIAHDFDGEVILTFAKNRVEKGFKIVPVKAPAYGELRRSMVEDLAVTTGGTLMTEENGIKPETFTEEMFGTASKISVSREDTTIVGGGGSQESVDKRIEDLKSQLDDTTQEWDDKEIKGRIAKLRGGVAVIYVGANTSPEMKEKKDRVEDALEATKSAVEEGIVAGGGVALLEAMKVLDSLKVSNSDQRKGVNILKKSVTSPFAQIAFNSGLKPKNILKEAIRLGYPVGYDAKENNFGDMLVRGIIDPKKVTRVALESAASIATLILTSEATVSIPNKKE